MNRKIVILLGLCTCLFFASCASNPKDSIKEKLTVWTDSVITRYEDLSQIQIDSISSSDQDSKWKRIQIYSPKRQDYLLIAGMDTLVHRTQLYNESNTIILSVLREFCSARNSPKTFTRIIQNGVLHGYEKSLNCDTDSLRMTFFSHGVMIE